MNRNFLARLSLLVLCGFGLCACQSGTDELGNSEGSSAETTAAAQDNPVVAPEERRISPGKPTAPIDIDYEILGQPVVGIPLSINVKVSSSLDQPITVKYRIGDVTSLMFSDAQARSVTLVPLGDKALSTEQVTVIPQREGRLFLNVSAEIETEIGMMARVMAIPIQVGSLRPAPRLNGDPITAVDGEALISMPAKED